MKYSIISCITGGVAQPISVDGVTSWNTLRETEDVLNNLGDTNGLDPDDFYTTRSPERVSEILEVVRVLWLKNPDMRLGQLLYNLLSTHQEIFHVEDDVLLRKLKWATISGLAAGRETL